MQRVPEILRMTMLAFAKQVMERPPDFTVGDRYLERWLLQPRGDVPNVYIHRFRADDEDAALHDHPYDNVSVILENDYYEHLHVHPMVMDGERWKTYRLHRKPGDVVARKATVFHRLEMCSAKPVVSMFFTGDRVRDWGFLCPGGFVPWQEFTNADGSRNGCP